MISVVIAVRNGALTLQRCLDSVFAQSGSTVELVVIDGASSDGTQDIIELNRTSVAYSVSESDTGVSDAWNKALEHVRGDWVIFLGADDVLRDPEVMRRAADRLAAAGTTRVVYGRVEVMDSDGTVRHTIGRPWSDARRDFMTRMSIPHQGTFHHRSLFEEHGRFDTSFRIVGDYEFLLRELITNDALYIPDLIITQMGAGGLSDRPETREIMAREFFRARQMHGLVTGPAWRSGGVFRARTFGALDRFAGRRAADAAVRAYRAVVRRPEG
jgi:glycosyltransferase involved in cell wall biosynthesis